MTKRRADEPRVYGAKEAAAALGVRQTNLRAVVGLPEPYQKLRASTLWRADVIDGFAAERRERRARRRAERASKQGKPDVMPVTPVAAEGARVGFATCPECGAAILLDPRDERDRLAQHADWHRGR